METNYSRNSKRIVKNTLFLYIRMISIMGVTLFTSRVVLDKLGIVDYGLYSAIGGVVGMLSFLNNTLSIGTSRFLTYELGTNNLKKLNTTFCTTFYTHLILALGIVIIMETIGLWFVYNKLIIPPDRLYSALWAYHISVLTTFISFTQVPYTSAIIAHENMTIYAYLGIFEAVAKLIIVYVLSVSSADKLIFYAILVAGVQLLVALFYRIYCVKYYREARLNLSFDRRIFREMLSFSGWGLLANVSQMLSVQGMVVLINMFFQPAIVAAQAIGNQITAAMMQFVTNLRTAINPQVIKLYAAKDFAASRKLTLQSSIYVFELLLLIGLPAIVVMKPLLNLWLVEVPPYGVIFSQYIVLKEILNIYNGTFYTPMIASGELRLNSFASVGIGGLSFVVLYIMFKSGMDVMWVQYIGVIQTILAGFIIKPFILCKKIGYSRNEILLNFYSCFKVSALPVLASILCSQYIVISEISGVIWVVSIICMSVVISAYIFLDNEMRKRIHCYIHERLVKCYH